LTFSIGQREWQLPYEFFQVILNAGLELPQNQVTFFLAVEELNK